jgi:hypothetical protein
MSRRILENIVVTDWDSKDPGTTHFNRVRYLQQIDDTLNRPLLNRVTASTNATAVNLNGAVQSTGIGAGPITPKRYAEFTVKARVTFNISAGGTLYVFVYRTTGAIPANGAAPGGADIIVGGDSFAGPATVAGQNMNGAFSFIDTGLDVTKQYRYYLAVKGTNALVGNLVNASQLLVLERS